MASLGFPSLLSSSPTVAPGHMLRVRGDRVKMAVDCLPGLDVGVAVRPITATVLKLDLRITVSHRLPLFTL